MAAKKRKTKSKRPRRNPGIVDEVMGSPIAAAAGVILFTSLVGWLSKQSEQGKQAFSMQGLRRTW